ncbi:MAG: D-2-hydroxyacid dehydrogenase [Planctomycetales bacterium]|nr:D-2-hydroxyacid dehydrogenase [Planctomycetales bacterium]
MRIVLCYPVEARHVDQIRATAPDCEVVDAGQDGVAREILDADVFCGHAKVPVPWDDVVRQGRLRWIQSSAAGTDHCLVESVIESDITVTSASGVLADQVTEHAVALICGWCRNMPTFYAAQQRREFIRRPTRDLHHSTVGIVGFGGVGRRLASVLQVFKTRIIASDLFPLDKPDYVDELLPAEGLANLLAVADIVILSAPLTAATRGMINRETLRCMKPDALLVNMARGALVVEADLVAALESGLIAGAALDVTETEPLPAESRLWSAPGVIITPHVAGQSARRIDDMTEFFCDNLARYLVGEPLRNVVDKRLGFPVPTVGHVHP